MTIDPWPHSRDRRGWKRAGPACAGPPGHREEGPMSNPDSRSGSSARPGRSPGAGSWSRRGRASSAGGRGLYQGLAELRRRNWEPLPATRRHRGVVLTHAHLDHCGYLPRLVRDGFRAGPVHARDGRAGGDRAARQRAPAGGGRARCARAGLLQARPGAAALRQRRRRAACSPLLEPVAYGERVRARRRRRRQLQPGRPHPRFGHAAGRVGGQPGSLFSGDLGRPHHPLLLPPRRPRPADAVVVESTYGERSHAPPRRRDVLAGRSAAPSTAAARR